MRTVEVIFDPDVCDVVPIIRYYWFSGEGEDWLDIEIDEWENQGGE